jgi:hypothetical protein
VLGVQDDSFLNNGLVGYWPMDETSADTCTGGSNDTCDASGNGNDGAWTNATSGDGKFGAGVTFDGSGDYVEVVSPTGLPSGDVAKTLAMWFKISTCDSGATIGGFGTNSSGENFQIEICESSIFRVLGWGTDWSTSVSNTPYIDGNWHHVAATYDGTTTILYLDGVSQDTTTSYSWATNPVRVVIGDEIDKFGRAHTGEVDEMRIYDRALSPHRYRWQPSYRLLEF